MSGILRSNAVGEVHHVVLHGSMRQRLFSYDFECAFFVKILAAALQKYPCRLHALGLRSVEVHALITPLEHGSLSKCIKMCSQTYSLMRNQRRKRSGKLFASRFSSFPLPTLESQGIATAYIDLYPPHNAVPNAKLWSAWSTLGQHDGASECRLPSQIWTPSEWFKCLGQDSSERHARYRSVSPALWERRHMLTYLRLDRLASRSPTVLADAPLFDSFDRRAMSHPFF